MSQQEPEKDQDKHEEEWRGHRRWRRGGRFPGLLFGLILILVGFLFFAQNEGWIHGDWWPFLLIGVGVIILVEGLFGKR
jgi:hypothetical protein